MLAERGQKAGTLLQAKRENIFIVEATTGGLISACLLAVPGASRYYVGQATVYSGRGASNLLPQDLLEDSGLMDVAYNYKNRENYIASKEKFTIKVAEYMRKKVGCTYCLVESGTMGPIFHIPGVQKAFTSVAIAGPNDECHCVTIHEGDHKNLFALNDELDSRERNMWNFTEAALHLLEKRVEKSKGQPKKRSKSKL